MAAGGWGPVVNAKKLEKGDQGPAVVALRNRLMLMGYLPRSAAGTYDAALEKAVQSFQSDHGLETDGVAGPGTIDEINKPVSARLKSIIIAMERERWLTPDRGVRHILVNQTDFTAKIVDNGDVTFETRSVIGKNTHDRRSPEFSDEMEHMVINPSWYVPRSIITKEYLPKLQQQSQCCWPHPDHRPARSGGEPRFGRFLAIHSAEFSVLHAPAAEQPQRAGAGQVHVPEQIQHLSA